MHAPARRFSVFVLLIATALLLGGCASAPDPSRPAPPMQDFAYDSPPAPSRIDASATVDVSGSFDYDMNFFWRRTLGGADRVASALSGISEAIRTDITQSGLFSSIVPPGQGGADYRVVITYEEVVPANTLLRMKLSLFNRAGQEIFSRSAESPIGVKAISPSRIYITPTRQPSFPGDNGPDEYSHRLLLVGCTRAVGGGKG